MLDTTRQIVLPGFDEREVAEGLLIALSLSTFVVDGEVVLLPTPQDPEDQP
jgi:hypothetical protein